MPNYQNLFIHSASYFSTSYLIYRIVQTIFMNISNQICGMYLKIYTKCLEMLDSVIRFHLLKCSMNRMGTMQSSKNYIHIFKTLSFLLLLVSAFIYLCMKTSGHSNYINSHSFYGTITFLKLQAFEYMKMGAQ